KESFAHGALLLEATQRVAVCTGIINIWARDAVAMRAGQLALADAYPGRFVLALGVSHRPSVAERGLRYERPLKAMGQYLDAMEAAAYVPPRPAEEPPKLIGALHPKMLALAAERTQGTHPYFVPVAHTLAVREQLGPGPVVAPELAIVLEAD